VILVVTVITFRRKGITLIFENICWGCLW